MSGTSLMAQEIAETPHALARLVDREGPAVRELGARLRGLDPPYAASCARGSSDHAAGLFKYLCEIVTGRPVASVGPSVASVYEAPLRMGGALLVSVSQSGRSPDIVALQAAARRGGALTLAVVNDAASPLAAGAEAVVPLHAGPERSVAATKTCLASMLALAWLVAEWREDDGLRRAVLAMPEACAAALRLDWSEPAAVLVGAASAYTVGRGPAFPVAQEAALKLKETAALHAEAFSGAEVMHGPLQLVQPGFPVIAFRPQDAASAAMGGTVERLRGAGGRVFTAEAGPPAPGRLPVAGTGHPLLDPLPMLLAFYGLAEGVARARGHDPDRPSHLAKVTETV